MKNVECQNEIKKFALDVKAIPRWFRGKGHPRNEENILEMYRHITRMWHKQREIFANKGHYKMIRRVFIKHTINYFDCRPEKWHFMPPELCKEILDKINQGWASPYIIGSNWAYALYISAKRAGYSKQDPRLRYFSAATF